MSSRLKQNPERTFNWFFEATCPVTRDKDPGVLFQFPENFSDQESCQILPRFCFPYDVHRLRDAAAVQHFTFVLTDVEGCQRFGFCRLTNSTHTCLCILSYLPWFEVFYKLLNYLADYLTKGQGSQFFSTEEVTALLAALYKQNLPLPDGSITLQMGEQLLVSTKVSHPHGHPQGPDGIPYFIAPDPQRLPSIPENRNLTELIVAVDVGNLLQLYASMLFERRILIFASKLSTLTSCVHALSATLYPMFWQHIFIPVLPPHLLDFCSAPMPYLIGVHTSLSERVRSRGLEDVVVLNVDTNTLESSFDDLKKIPSEVTSELKVCLKRQALAPGCGVSRAFLRAQCQLFGGYRDALQCQPGGQLWFSEEKFLHHKSPTMRRFLQSATHLQSFKQFIDDRLDLLNAGKEPDDLFEEEIAKCETRGGGRSYQQLVGHLKKGSGALILNMKSRANKSAGGLARSGLKNLLTHKAPNDGHTLQRGGSLSQRRAQSDSLQSRLPITQHFGMSRPRRPAHKPAVTRDGTEAGDVVDSASSGTVTQVDPDLQKVDQEEGDDSFLCDPEELDLLGEIFDSLSTSSFHDRGLLYGTRSLDLFGPDSNDFITKLGPVDPSQENLSLSISGSSSLHSWSLETTEEDLTESLLSLNTTAPDEERSEVLTAASDLEGQQGGQREVRGVEVLMDVEGDLADRRNSMDPMFDEGTMTEDPDSTGSYEGDQSQKVLELQHSGMTDQQEEEERQREEAQDSMDCSDQPDEAVEEPQTQEDNLHTSVSSTGSKQLPAVTTDQQGHGLDRSGSLMWPRTDGPLVPPHPSCDPGLHEVGGTPPSKVSELKKMFETNK